jgi:hypothetical protein
MLSKFKYEVFAQQGFTAAENHCFRAQALHIIEGGYGFFKIEFARHGFASRDVAVEAPQVAGASHSI